MILFDFSTRVTESAIAVPDSNSQVVNQETASLLNSSRIYLKEGKLSLASFQLDKLLKLTQEEDQLAIIWKLLGDISFRRGNYQESINNYHKSLDLEKSLATLNNLVSVYLKQEKIDLLKARSSNFEFKDEYIKSASKNRQMAEDLAGELIRLAQKENFSSFSSIYSITQLNKLGIDIDYPVEQVFNTVKELDDSTDKIFLLINLSKIDKSKNWLNYAYEVAKATNNSFAESHVLISLASRAKEAKKSEEALSFAKLGQLKAQSGFALDTIFKSSLIIARILRERGKDYEALIAYRQAINALNRIRENTINIDINERLDFSDQIESVYRELIEILLNKNNLNKEDLEEVLLLKDGLQLTQLQTFFGDNCFIIKSDFKNNERNLLVEENAAIFSSIILENSTHFILRTEDGSLFHHKVNLPESEIQKLALNWSQKLQQRSSRRFLNGSSYFYDLLIKPFEAQLRTFNPSKIVFINDSILRNLPMSALYDKNTEMFLSEKWASISSLGLNIKQTNVDLSKTALFGLSQAKQGFLALNSIPEEIDRVSQITKGKSFLDKRFTIQRVSDEINRRSYSILHFATHGYFGGGSRKFFYFGI